MVAAVATLEPEQAANKAQEAMLVCNSPPGISATQRERAVYISSARPLRSTSSPIMIKRGMANHVQSLYVPHALVAIWFHRGASVKKYVRIKDVTPMAAATYRPPMKKTPIRPNAMPTAIQKGPSISCPDWSANASRLFLCSQLSQINYVPLTTGVY